MYIKLFMLVLMFSLNALSAYQPVTIVTVSGTPSVTVSGTAQVSGTVAISSMPAAQEPFTPYDFLNVLAVGGVDQASASQTLTPLSLNNFDLLVRDERLRDVSNIVGIGLPTYGVGALGSDGTNGRLLKTNTSGELQVGVTSGTVAVSNFPAVQVVSGTLSVDTTGLATSANQTNGNQKTQLVNSLGSAVGTRALGSQLVSGDVGLVVNSLIHGLSSTGGGTFVDVKVTPSGALVADVSNSSVTVSGTTQLTAGTATIGSINNISGTISLPTGAATESTLNSVKTAVELLDNTVSGTKISTTYSDSVVSGTITTQNLVPTGVATANSAVETGFLDGYASAMIGVSGTYTGNLSIQYTVDGNFWETVASSNAVLSVANGTYGSAIASAATGNYIISPSGAAKFRVTALAAVTGTARITIRLSQAATLSQITTGLRVNNMQIQGTTISTGNGTTGAGSQRVTIASDNTAFNVLNTEVRSASATVSSVNSSASSTTCLASNTSRRKASFFNDSTSTAYLKFGSTASSVDYTVQMASNQLYEIPTPVYTGVVDCIWSSANGSMKVTWW